MPLYEYLCTTCRQTCELLVASGKEAQMCPSCGNQTLTKQISAPSAMRGDFKERLPGAGDTACCGSSPATASGCAGPGSCCGKAS